MMLVGLAEHNQPQPQSEPDLALLVPVLPHSPQTSSCHLQEAQLARLLSVSACNDSFSPPPLHHHHHLRPLPARHIASALSSSLRPTTTDPQFPTKVTRAITISEQTAGQEYRCTSLRA